MTIKRKILFAIFSGIAVFALFLGTVLFSTGKEGAEAARQKVMTIEQSEAAVFCGRTLIDKDGYFCDTDENTVDFENPLFDTFIFKLDDRTLNDLSHSDVRVALSGEVYKPDSFVGDFYVTYDGDDYIVRSVAFAVSKRLVEVSTLLNGRTELRVEEGTTILLSYDYQGAIEDHSRIVTYNGVTVTEILREYLSLPAWADIDTTKPVENYRVVAAHAESDYYDFKYIGATLTIVPSTVYQLTYSDESATRLILNGNFSVLHSVQYTDIGISPTSERYSVISARADAAYKDSRFFDKYEKVGCFSIDVTYNNNPVNESIASTALVRATTLDASKEYKIIALYANGSNDVLNAKLTDGYLSFDAADCGDFIIVSEIEGLSLTYYIIVIVSGIAVLVFVVLLVAVFRRKY